jgi:hypothetical protein
MNGARRARRLRRAANVSGAVFLLAAGAAAAAGGDGQKAALREFWAFVLLALSAASFAAAWKLAGRAHRLSY